MVFPSFPSFSDRTTSQEEADDSEESHAAHSRVVQAIPGVKFQQIIGGYCKQEIVRENRNPGFVFLLRDLIRKAYPSNLGFMGSKMAAKFLPMIHHSY